MVHWGWGWRGKPPKHEVQWAKIHSVQVGTPRFLPSGRSFQSSVEGLRNECGSASGAFDGLWNLRHDSCFSVFWDRIPHQFFNGIGEEGKFYSPGLCKRDKRLLHRVFFCFLTRSSSFTLHLRGWPLHTQKISASKCSSNKALWCLHNWRVFWVIDPQKSTLSSASIILLFLTPFYCCFY